MVFSSGLFCVVETVHSIEYQKDINTYQESSLQISLNSWHRDNGPGSLGGPALLKQLAQTWEKLSDLASE